MAYRKVDETSLTTIANAIRAKTGGSTKLSFPSGFKSSIEGLTSAKLVKVGTETVTYTSITVDCKSHPKWAQITADDILVVPKNFSVFTTSGETEGKITTGTYNFVKKYSNGVLTISRESVPGSTGLSFDCDFYVYA